MYAGTYSNADLHAHARTTFSHLSHRLMHTPSNTNARFFTHSHIFSHILPCSNVHSNMLSHTLTVTLSHQYTFSQALKHTLGLTYTPVRTHTHTHRHTHTGTHTHIISYKPVHTHTHTHQHTHTHTHLLSHTYLFTQYLTHTYLFTHTTHLLSPTQSCSHTSIVVSTCRTVGQDHRRVASGHTSLMLLVRCSSLSIIKALKLVKNVHWSSKRLQ